MKSTTLLRLIALAGLVGPTFAQSGPWTDGEVVVLSPASGGGGLALHRIAPETGHGEVLVGGSSGYGGWSGKVAFDPYRNALLVNLALPPDGLFTYKLWAVNWDGTKAAIPGFSGATLRALCPTGDGRVYFQDHATGATNAIQYIDSANTIHTLMNSTNTAPFLFAVEHMIFHAPSNSLIASTSSWWSTNDCASTGSSLFRIPLSTDGSRVSGAVTCTSVSNAYAAEEIMSLDYLPGGNLLITLASGVPGYAPDKLMSVNPWTLAVSGWAHPAQMDLNGGLYSTRIGKAIVLDDGPNQLRTFVPGQPGLGTLLACDVPLGDATTGYSPAESIWEIDTNGPGCQGLTHTFGAGLAGSNNVIPALGVVGCPDVNSSFTISIDNVVGGASGLLVVGTAPAAIPALGGTLYVYPIALQFPVTVGGTPGAAGAGSFGLPLLVTDPALTGLTLFMQAGFIDGTAVQGVSLTNGLQLVIG